MTKQGSGQVSWHPLNEGDQWRDHDQHAFSTTLCPSLIRTNLTDF